MNNLPARQNDVWKPATETEKAAALASLAALPSRQMSSEALDRASYYVALEDVTRHGLSEAVRAILRGALGHAFFPSPPELRIQCDKAMEWHERERDRIRRREESAKGLGRPVEHSEESKARVAKLYAEFCASYEKREDRSTAVLDPDLVAQVPDNPKSMARQRMGSR